MLGYQRVALLERDWKVWPCWRKFVTGGGLWRFKNSTKPSVEVWRFKKLNQARYRTLSYLSCTMSAYMLPCLGEDNNGLNLQTISQPQLNAFLYGVAIVVVSLHRDRVPGVLVLPVAGRGEVEWEWFFCPFLKARSNSWCWGSWDSEAHRLSFQAQRQIVLISENQKLVTTSFQSQRLTVHSRGSLVERGSLLWDQWATASS